METATRRADSGLLFIGFILLMSSDVDLTWLFPLDYFLPNIQSCRHQNTASQGIKNNQSPRETDNFQKPKTSQSGALLRVKLLFVCVCICASLLLSTGFPAGSVLKNPPVNAGDRRHRFGPWVRKIPPGEGNPLQYSCLGNPRHREAWRAIVHGIARVRHDWATKQQYYQQRLTCDDME